jgi:hypothetical protein
MVNKKYLTGLSKKDKETKTKNIKKTQQLLKEGKKDEAISLAKKRPTTKEKKQSGFTMKFKKKFPDVKPLTKEFTSATGIPLNIQRAVVKRGEGAYLSAGSRASVSSPRQWGIARLYAFYFKGIQSKLDFDEDLMEKVKNLKK